MRHELSPEIAELIAAQLRAAAEARLRAESIIQGLCTAEALRAFGAGKAWRLTEDGKALEQGEKAHGPDGNG